MKKKQFYALNLAGRTVRYLLRWPGTEAHLNAFSPEPLHICDSDTYDVILTDQDIARDRPLYPADVTISSSRS